MSDAESISGYHTKLVQLPGDTVSHGLGSLHWKRMTQHETRPQTIVKHVTEWLGRRCCRAGVRRATNSEMEHFDAQMARMYKMEAA